jgi:hypothetical protein
MAGNETKATDKLLDGVKKPTFPFHYFPDFLKELIKESKENLNYPEEVTAAGILSTVAACMGNSLTFDVLGQYRAKPILWLCVVAPKGYNKSHPISRALEPLNAKIDAKYKEHQEKLKEFEQSDDKKGRPQFYPAIINEGTYEGVVKALQKNPHGVLTHSDELASWVQNFGRYNKGSDAPFYNTLFNGEGYKQIRKNADNSCYVTNPCWSIIGNLQNNLLAEYFGGDNIQSGFFDRMQFVFPHSNEYTSSSTAHSPEKWDQYDAGIDRLYETSHTQEPSYIRAEDEAFQQFYDLFGFERNGLDDNDPKRGLASKAQTMLPRWCLVAHGMSVAFEGKGWLENLTRKELLLANELTHFFYQSGLYAYSLVSDSSPLDALPADKRLLYDRIPDYEVSRAEIMDLHEALLKKKIISGTRYNISERTIGYFLKQKQFFRKSSYGKYCKVY